jgi:membrane associated rhomboid family serine protease
MSIYNRDYMREGSGPQKLGTPSSWNVVSWLLAINTAVFLATLLSVGRLADFLGLSVQSLTSFYLWTPITYQFTHAGVLHFIGNMIGLFFLGRLLMGIIGPRQTLRIYLLGGLVGGFVQVLYNLLVGPDGNIIGASASVLAILAATATLVPHQSFQLLLFFIIPINMTLRTMAFLVIGMDVITLILTVTGQAVGIAVFAHFGGMLFGWLWIRNGWFERSSRPRKTKKRKGLLGVRILRDEEEATNAKKPFVTNDVDAILDKINEKGFQSLTEEERKKLERSSNHLSRRLDDPS